MSLNRVFLLGRLGADPELRYTQSQVPVCNMRIATNERRKSGDGQWEEHTEWHSVVTFNRTAENCGQYLSKGRQVFVEGQLRTSKWTDQEGKERYRTEIIGNNVQFIGGRNEGMTVERTTPQQTSAGAGMDATFADSASAEVSFDDDDIPF